MTLFHDPTASHDDIAAVAMPDADADAGTSADATIEVTADVAPVAPPIPDRADAPVSEIAERFLKMVLTHVPLERIEELHLFSPLRQGGVETGIAVIAARVPVLVVAAPDEPELPFDAAPAVSEVVVEELVEELVVAEESIEAEGAVEAVEADAAVEADVVVVDDRDVAVAPPVPRVRHTVYTARYRLVQKGPERGKWEANVVAEADAPLVTVDLVVRGVQRRAGEESEIVRYSAPQLARALRIVPPVVAPIATSEG
ncbi:MAG: hypothetical protein P3B76_14710 [Gemmatimonadota bacterium]|nr:hypothetical protein [Gemmatimonadota bacterium]MDQ8173930.1 hypothetical protein [Gemmatimonadota bacterium]